MRAACGQRIPDRDPRHAAGGHRYGRPEAGDDAGRSASRPGADILVIGRPITGAPIPARQPCHRGRSRQNNGLSNDLRLLDCLSRRGHDKPRPMATLVKICGITAQTRRRPGAGERGFRGSHVPSEIGSPPARRATRRRWRQPYADTRRIVALFASPDDHDIEQAVRCDQAGRPATPRQRKPARIATIRDKSGLPVIKAVRCGDRGRRGATRSNSKMSPIS